MKLISFIIPVYRNKGTITSTYEKLKERISTVDLNYNFKAIFVNDGSDDGSWEEIKQLQLKENKVKAISFSKNFGQVPAIIAGSRFCKRDAAIIITADLQDPISLVGEMIESWENSFIKLKKIRGFQ
jgi:dolichol-phosphate mannosyltransferase